VFLFIFGVLVLSLSFLWEGFGLLWPMLSGLFWMVIYIAVLLRASLLFTEEKERGSLQLLLATPLTDREVIDGKLTVLVREFGLYAGILCVLGVFGAFCFPSSLGGDAGAPFYSAISSLAFFIWTAAVALWSSLVSATATRAVVLTIACFFGYHLVMSIPIALLMLFGRGAAVFCVWSILHLVIAWLVYRWMVRNLRAYCARA
jgi:ABC-type transport system involved in multi-copper enzyme maturation permease subunit